MAATKKKTIQIISMSDHIIRKLECAFVEFELRELFYLSINLF